MLIMSSLVVLNSEQQPAPVSPVDSDAWRLLSSSIKRAFHHKYPDLVVSPGCELFETPLAFSRRSALARGTPLTPLVHMRYSALELSNGNSDTQFYLRLTRNVYRFSPSQPSADQSIHTVRSFSLTYLAQRRLTFQLVQVNEKLDFEDHLNGIWFYHELIRLADESDLK